MPMTKGNVESDYECTLFIIPMAMFIIGEVK